MRFDSDFDRCTAVAWAAGMVAAQSNCTLHEAAELMAARSVQTHVAVEDVAAAVIERGIRFDQAAVPDLTSN